MKMKHNTHLTDDKISQAALGEIDLTSRERAHLDTCDKCARKTALLNKDLKILKYTVQGMIPESNLKISLPEQEKRKKIYDIKTIIGKYGRIAATSAVIIIAVLSFYISGTLTDQGEKDFSRSITSYLEESLIDSIFTFEDDVLSETYLEIACVSFESDNDDFYQFLVPPI